MEEIQQTIFGIVILAIGVILIFKHKVLIRMAIESQKGVDHVLGKNRSYSGAEFSLIPRIIAILIGICFSIWGVFSVLSSF